MGVSVRLGSEEGRSGGHVGIRSLLSFIAAWLEVF
jgi:hypothetical protein